MNPLRKCISLQSDNHPRHEHENDYLKQDVNQVEINRNFVRESGAKWVKLWVYWHTVQPAPTANPADAFAAWDAMNADPNGVTRGLEEQIKAANQDGLGVIVTCDRWAPWANPNGTPTTMPTDRSTSGPWAWFIWWLILRFNGQPGQPFVHAIEIMNEPNLGKVCTDTTLGCGVTQMILTADAVANAARSQGRYVPTLLAPALADTPGAPQFARDVLGVLDLGWSATGPMYWSHHNYRDTKNFSTEVLNEIHQALGEFRWTGRGDKRRIWITEGGCEVDWILGNGSAGTYTPPGSLTSNDYAGQANRINSSYYACQNHPAPWLWTTHEINDPPAGRFQSGLFNEYQFTPNRQGPRRAAADTFKAFPSVL